MDNAKEVLLKLIKQENLEIIKIDCYNEDGDCCLHSRKNCEGPKTWDCNPQHYTSLDDLNFIYEDDSCVQELYGIVYCLNKVTKQPVWLTRCCNDVYSYWQVNRIPEFYNNYKIK